MTIELAIFIALTAILFNVVSFWAITKMKDDQLKIAKRVWDRLDYLEIGMSYHGMIPMPWEAEALEEHVEEIKAFKQEGNVVYLETPQPKKEDKHE